jgi:hypothetical protein
VHVVARFGEVRNDSLDGLVVGKIGRVNVSLPPKPFYLLECRLVAVVTLVDLVSQIFNGMVS